MLLLLSCWIIAGITGAEPPTEHYRVKNSSLCLQVGKSRPLQHTSLTWRFNEKVIVHNKQISRNYTDKVDYNSEDHSLCINKLTETDSGTYTFSILDIHLDESTETHRLIVQKTVPRPVIKISVMHFNLSTGFCNITVNCSIQDDWVWSVCDGDRCRTSQRSFRKVNVTIFTDNSSIVCSGKNHVSTSNVSESMEATCFSKSNPEHEETSQPFIGIVIVIAVCVSLCAFIVCVVKGLFSTQYNHHQAQTSTAQLIHNQPVEAQPQPVQRVSTSSSQAEVSYENVDATQPTQTSSPTISPRVELGSKQSQKVESVYSVLQVPKVSDSSKDAKGHKKTQGASTSQSVALGEAEQPTQIDTVYSVLQKPKDLKSQHHQ